MKNARKYVVTAALLLVAAASEARAQSTTTSTPPKPESRIKSTLIFLSGAASGLAIHESGHVLFSAAFDAHPRLRSLEGSVIPFFKIQHDPVTRRKELAISSAGLWMQHLDS